MRTPKEIFDDIVKLASSIGKTEEVVNDVVSEEVVEMAEEVAEEPATEEPAIEVAPTEEPKEMAGDYVTRAEYNAALAELKEMYTKVLEVVSPAGSKDVPEDLSSQKTEEEVSVEMSEDTPVEEVEVAPTPEVDEVKEPTAPLAEEAAADNVVHSPEAQVEEKQTFLYGQGRVKTTADYVFESMFKRK